MPVLSKFRIEISAQEVMDSLNRGRKTPRQMIGQAETALSLARDLLQPASVYDWIKVLAVEGEHVLFASRDQNRKFRLHVGPHADLLAKAEIALVSVHSIGPKLDERVRELNATGESLLGYLLDSVGLVALGKVGEAVHEFAEKEAQRRGWGVGAYLSPGSLVGWALSGQIDLCALLPLNQIGVHLNDSGILVPFKSVSGLIGIGPEYKSKRVGSVCRFCMHAETCWRRQDTHDDARNTPPGRKTSQLLLESIT